MNSSFSISKPVMRGGLEPACSHWAPVFPLAARNGADATPCAADDANTAIAPDRLKESSKLSD